MRASCRSLRIGIEGTGGPTPFESLRALHCPDVNLHGHRLLDKLDREN
jgi:hypothetical protein